MELPKDKEAEIWESCPYLHLVLREGPSAAVTMCADVNEVQESCMCMHVSKAALTLTRYESCVNTVYMKEYMCDSPCKDKCV